MLRIDLGALTEGPIDLAQAVPMDDPLFEQLDFRLSGAVQLSGRLMEAGAGSYYWQGSLRTRVRASCRRCLADVEVEIDQPVGVLFTEDERTDDPAASRGGGTELVITPWIMSPVDRPPATRRTHCPGSAMAAPPTALLYSSSGSP